MINGMMGFIFLSFFTIVTFLSLEIWQNHEAISAGLQQCKVGNEVLWKKDCQ